MVNPRSALTEPLSAEAVPQSARFGGKFLAPLAFFVGLSVAVLLSCMRGDLPVEEPAVTMYTQPARARIFSQPSKAWTPMQSGRARQILPAAVGSAGVADKVSSLLKESFP